MLRRPDAARDRCARCAFDAIRAHAQALTTSSSRLVTRVVSHAVAAGGESRSDTP